MNPELPSLGRALIVFGLILAGFGVLLVLGPKVPWLGRLPGDIYIHNERVSFYFPLASSLLASLLLSLIFWIINRFR